jgi:hypothetical protein
MRTQTITLKNGMEVIINHDSKDKCEKCKKNIFWAIIPIELVGLAKWDLHKCNSGKEFIEFTDEEKEFWKVELQNKIEHLNPQEDREYSYVKSLLEKL